MARALGRRGGRARCLALAACAGFLLLCLLAGRALPAHPAHPGPETSVVEKPFKKRLLTNKPKLAVIVPFRDRFEELLDFIPHMYNFLNKQNIPFHIYIIQQRDNYRFNRASLINVGFLYTRNDYDYIAMHDVDLLPINDKLSYEYPDKGPFHVSAPDLHPKYHYATFIGGILLMSRQHFELVDGMSNRYWGWGLEDDELYVRLKDAGLTVYRPSNITTGTENTFKHVHNRAHRKRDTRKCYNQREVTRRRDRQTGLHDVDYRLTGRHEMTVNGLSLTVVDVELACDQATTPWCLCPEPPPATKSKKT